jgi:hypothetical protein
MVKYTDSQLRSMTEAPWLWSDQLRKEAKRRGLAVTLVTPLAEVASLLLASLKALLVIMLVAGCKPSRWEGISDDRVCSATGAGSHASVTCISGGKVYACVRDGDVVHCSRDTVETKCTNIVNVETVCPGKP